MEFSRQEYWSGLPFPSPGALPDPGIESGSPALWADSSPSEPCGKPKPIITDKKERENSFFVLQSATFCKSYFTAYFYYLLSIFIVFVFACTGFFIAAHGLSLVAGSRACSLLWSVGFSLQWLLLLWNKALGCTGLVFPWHVESPQSRDWTHVRCISRRIFNQ